MSVAFLALLAYTSVAPRYRTRPSVVPAIPSMDLGWGGDLEILRCHGLRQLAVEDGYSMRTVLSKIGVKNLEVCRGAVLATPRPEPVESQPLFAKCGKEEEESGGEEMESAVSKREQSRARSTECKAVLRGEPLIDLPIEEQVGLMVTGAVERLLVERPRLLDGHVVLGALIDEFLGLLQTWDHVFKNNNGENARFRVLLDAIIVIMQNGAFCSQCRDGGAAT